MKIRIIQVGKTRDVDVSEYLKRIKPFAQIEIVELKEVSPSKTVEKGVCVDREGESILRSLTDGFVIALDEKGGQKSSREFAELLGKHKDMGETVTFVIGGAFGLSDAVREKADLVLSFSKMTFTHQMIRLFLMEQIYRGLCILAGKEYHND